MVKGFGVARLKIQYVSRKRDVSFRIRNKFLVS